MVKLDYFFEITSTNKIKLTSNKRAKKTRANTRQSYFDKFGTRHNFWAFRPFRNRSKNVNCSSRRRKRSFISTIRSTVQANPSRKLAALFKMGRNLTTSTFVFESTAKFSKMELFDSFSIIMWFSCPSFFQTEIYNDRWLPPQLLFLPWRGVGGKHLTRFQSEISGTSVKETEGANGNLREFHFTCSTITLGMLTLINANSCCKVCGWTATSGITSAEPIITESERAASVNSSRIAMPVSLVLWDGKLPGTSPLQAYW